jgi:hypothetical protein
MKVGRRQARGRVMQRLMIRINFPYDQRKKNGDDPAKHYLCRAEMKVEYDDTEGGNRPHYALR